MAEANITANIISGTTVTPGASSNFVVQTSVTNGQPVTGTIVTGAKGDKGDQGVQGEPGTIVAVSTTPPENPQLGDLWVDIS